ncbi:hypothetical protein [Sulfuriroseicoccus oceanibius]|uniref:Uncharacterized protein n=1 Tax=Sulfuriroseicoccus oceanibius TaxID=2707525 RepID=A0A6B3L9S6_9BACT|nr:hypothetical protein [Sulfuriroseicoccus oceanibius]QQL46306.1 hypothetical protein G3M56_006960 [Sulfuriroseicoccus oceanibius]
MIQLELSQMVILYICGMLVFIAVVAVILNSRRRRREREDWQRHLVCRGCMAGYKLERGQECAPCPHCGRVNRPDKHRPRL